MHTVIAAEALFFMLAFAKGAGIMLGYDILISARGPACRSRRLFLLGVRLDFCVFDVP